ncbi:hypothetical protein RFI_00188 [Reticulomyxa filosa]|uniref:Uncharacterized protein n=1 Tax=Reticulomyxa filosa TaxID=46433 RepID=X6PFU1_RETFI|nr:hypothetical protein RFI_00188 [Reticulomyxa filosa]|eukprot:ETO36874.1 hypothetical protein RFI_00188 [Reticulomyxa filosa]
MRGLIGGINNGLLFITHCPENIEVIDLKTMKSLTGIKNNIIPREKHKFGISFHCLVPLTMNNEKEKRTINRKKFFYQKKVVRRYIIEIFSKFYQIDTTLNGAVKKDLLYNFLSKYID